MSIIIDKIDFKNFRQYGTGTIRFNNENDYKLSVLVAKNGTGKTTLLNSITWCLYEKEQQLIDQKTALSVVSTAELKEAAENEFIPVYVAVTIRDGNDTIEFKREQSFKKLFEKSGNSIGIPGASSFQVSITRDGVFENTEIETGVDADFIVKKYFDPAIYDFYFFDGEQLREFFSPEKTTYIKGSIYNISQVTLLKTALDHVNKLKQEKARQLAKECPDIEVLINSQTEIENQKKLNEEVLEQAKKAQAKANEEFDKVDALLRNYEPIKKKQEERNTLEKKLNDLDNEKKVFTSERSEFIRKYYLLLKLYPRIQKTLQIIHAKEAAGDLPPTLDKNQIKLVLENLDKPCPLCDNPHIGETGRQHLEKLMKQITISSKTSNYLKEIKGALEQYLEEAQSYLDNKNLIVQKEVDIENRIRDTEKKLGTINSALANYKSSDDDKINVAEEEKKRTKFRDQISAAAQQIGVATTNIAMNKKDLEDLQKEINAAQKKLGKHEDLKQEIDILRKISEYYTSIELSITSKMREEIQAITWKFFDEMIWKKNTFGEIVIGEEYDITVKSKEKAVMTGSLSATEQMALAYAFTLAIHDASGKNCPLVIDSPLGRVSDENRENMAEALLNISKQKQIVMLLTPDEYSDAVRELYEGKASVREIQLTEDEKYIEGIK